MTTPLTVTQLFTPASSGVGQSGAVPLTPADGTWLFWELETAARVQLPTTSWQTGAPERTILAINAVLLSQVDAIVSQMAQGGFLQSAANGTVTYQALNGQLVTIAVTPDPSNSSQNPTGALGYLDLLGEGVYDTFRLLATYASGQLAIANTGAATAGPYGVGSYHASSPNSGKTYSNTSILSIPPGVIGGGGGLVSGVDVGLSFTVIHTSTPHGLSANQAVFIRIPTTSGVLGLNGVFAVVSSVTANTFNVSVTSSGSYTSGGQVYTCTVANMQADVLGIGSNAAPGAVSNPITQAPGVSISNIVAWSGSNWESNVSYAARCQLALAIASPNGPAQAYVYFAETAVQILSAATPSYQFTNGPVLANTYGNPQTGIVTTVVASATPVSTALGAAITPGSAQNPVTGATNTNPIAVTTANPHGIPGASGTVSISGVLGNLSTNGTNVATVTGGSSFTIPVAGSGAYAGGGSVEAGDLGQIDLLLQENVVPDGIVSAITVSALALPITILGTIVVPQADVIRYRAAVLTSLQAYLSSLPIGGLFPTETVPVSYAGVIEALGAAGIFVLGLQTVVRSYQNVTLNGGVVDVPFPSSDYQALLALATSIAVVGV